MSCWRGISAAAAATLQTVSSARLYINKGDHEQGPSGQKWPRFHDPSVFTASEPPSQPSTKEATTHLEYLIPESPSLILFS